jgi:hypothetical protein
MTDINFQIGLLVVSSFILGFEISKIFTYYRDNTKTFIVNSYSLDYHYRIYTHTPITKEMYDLIKDIDGIGSSYYESKQCIIVEISPASNFNQTIELIKNIISQEQTNSNSVSNYLNKFTK